MSDTVPVKDGGLYKRRDGKVVRAQYNTVAMYHPGKKVFRMINVRTGIIEGGAYCDGKRCGPIWRPGDADIIKEITP